ncbi:M50 family metallopeptidase [Nanoarchaeota archaeon]
MDHMAKRFGKIIRGIAYIGIVAGFIGIIMITFFLTKGLKDLIFVKDAPAVVSPIIPGVQVGGILLPFWIGIASIFVVVVVHEFAHGVVARAHKLKIKSSGFGMFAIFPIAFVEPDEKELKKQKDVVQHSVFAAGPWANVILAVLALLIVSFVMSPVYGLITQPIEPKGVSLINVTSDLPAEKAGLGPGHLITAIDNHTVEDYSSFLEGLKDVKPNQTIEIMANGTVFTLVTASHPTNPEKGYLGVFPNPGPRVELIHNTIIYRSLQSVIVWFTRLLTWIFILSLGIGLINLFPIFITDGARMLQIFTASVFKKEKKSASIWTKINAACLVILIMNMLIPFVRWLGEIIIK